MKNSIGLDRERVWRPYTQMQTAPPPIPIVGAGGPFVFTEDGRRLFDATSSWWTKIHGHNHPRINKALVDQVGRLEHVMLGTCTHRPAAELAEHLARIMPPGLNRIFYSDDGSTAVEVALKMAFQYWKNIGQPGRSRFIALDHAYHGDTLGAMSVSDESDFTASFNGMLFPVARAHSPYCYRCPVGLKRASCSIDCLRSLEELLERHGAAVAAVIIEPMLQGAGGMIAWPVEFLAGVARLVREYGTLLIADEVFTGFGRTGKMFACELAGVSPDIICLSKGLTAGYLPMAATAASDRIFRAFLSHDRKRTFFHGHSFTGNPLGCAAALESLEIFRTEPVLDRVRDLEVRFKQGLAHLTSHDNVGDVRIIGSVAAIELVRDKSTKEAGGYLDSVGPDLAERFLHRGLLMRPLGNVLYVAPPYVTTREQADWLVDQISSVLKDWEWPEH